MILYWPEYIKIKGTSPGILRSGPSNVWADHIYRHLVVESRLVLPKFPNSRDKNDKNVELSSDLCIMSCIIKTNECLVYQGEQDPWCEIQNSITWLREDPNTQLVLSKRMHKTEGLLRRRFVQSNYSGSWTEPVCVLHRICGHETEDDKKKIRDPARLFNSSVIISEWNTKKFLSFQRMWKSVFSRRLLLQYFLDWTKHVVYHVPCIRGKNIMHLHKILILEFFALYFVSILKRKISLITVNGININEIPFLFHVNYF